MNVLVLSLILKLSIVLKKQKFTLLFYETDANRKLRFVVQRIFAIPIFFQNMNRVENRRLKKD